MLGLGVTVFGIFTTGPIPETTTLQPTSALTSMRRILGPEDEARIVDTVGLFETEMYMSKMHGGHGGSKISAFKRCVFLEHIGAVSIADILMAAIKARPSPLRYLHLLHGGGAVDDIADDATAFGCRDWNFACVVTGVWPRDRDETEVARTTVAWVYDAVGNLLPFSSGVYGADLGPDPRDADLAARAFGPNLSRLAHLKHSVDPGNLLACACPLPKISMEQKIVILLTGGCGSGKDYCAEIWASAFSRCRHSTVRASVVSISDATKREYAAATGADLERLLRDRAYKEQYRPTLSRFFQSQVRQRPRLPEEHFLDVVHNAADVDTLLITGMRDEAPVAAFSHLISECRLLEVSIRATRDTRRTRREYRASDDDSDGNGSIANGPDSNVCPNLIFNNDLSGYEAAEEFFEYSLLLSVHDDLQRLANMVSRVSDFPRRGVEFRNVLGISKKPGGLTLCASLLQTHSTGD